MVTSNLIAIGLASVYFLAVFSLPEVKTVVNDTDEKNVDSFCVGKYFRTIYYILAECTFLPFRCHGLFRCQKRHG